MLDPLGVVTKTRAAIEEEGARMAEAPSTIVHNEDLVKVSVDIFSYIPELGTVPEIAVPDQLPNLPGTYYLSAKFVNICFLNSFGTGKFHNIYPVGKFCMSKT